MNPNNPTEETHYGALANIVVAAMSGYFQSSGTQKCTLLNREVSYMEMQLVVAMLTMLAIVYTKKPLPTAIVAALVKALISSGKLPVAKCSSDSMLANLGPGFEAGAMLVFAPAWIAFLCLLFIKIRGAMSTPSIPTSTTNTLHLMWPLAFERLNFDWQSIISISAFKITGDPLFLLALLYSMLKEKIEYGKCLAVACAMLSTFGHLWTAVIIYIVCRNGTRKKLLKVLLVLIAINIVADPHTVIAPTDYKTTVQKRELQKAAGKLLVLMALDSLISLGSAIIYNRLPSYTDTIRQCSNRWKKPLLKVSAAVCAYIWIRKDHPIEVDTLTALIFHAYVLYVLQAKLYQLGYSTTRLDLWQKEPVNPYKGADLKPRSHWKLSIFLLLISLPVVEAFGAIYQTIWAFTVLAIFVAITFAYYFSKYREETLKNMRRGYAYDHDHTYSTKPTTDHAKAWASTMNNWGWLLNFINQNKLFCCLAIFLYNIHSSDAWSLFRREPLWYENISIGGITHLLATSTANYMLYTINGLEAVITAMLNGFTISFMDAAIIWLVIFFTIAIIQKRIPAVNACGIIGLICLLQWGGLQYYYWSFVWIIQACNVLWYALGSWPKFPGIFPCLFLLTVQPVLTFFLKNHLMGVRVVPMWYFIVFFGTLVLEFTPLISNQVLVIEKDVVTGRIIKQYRRNGPLTALIFGSISTTWDVVRQSAAIGAIYEQNRFSTALNTLRHMHMLVDQSRTQLLNGEAEVISDARASGYVTYKGNFAANCQAITHNGMTGILANVHTVYDETGKVREDLEYHFPGQGVSTKAVPVVSYGGHDLVILGPEKDLKYAYKVSNSMPGTVIVQGYNADKKFFSKVVSQKCGMTQMHLKVGHSGCAMVNPDTGALVSILWLTSEQAQTAQFIGLNPWILTKKAEISNWITQSSLQLDKVKTTADLNDVRQRLTLARQKMLSADHKKHEAVSVCDAKLKLLEEELENCSESAIADLVIEHKLYCDLANEVVKEKKSLLEKLRFKRSEKEKLLKERNQLACSDTLLVSKLRQEAKQLNKKLEEINAAIVEETGFKIPVESRMPTTSPKVNWPIIYKDGDKWYTYWSKTEKEESSDPPLANAETIERVMRETGLQRRAAIKFCSGHLYNKDWAKSMLERANMDQSVIKAILDWWCGETRVTCSYCGRKFECKENHKHGDKCNQMCITDCQRHSEYCGANSYQNDRIVVEGWNYPLIEGKVALGHGRHYLTKCTLPHRECVTTQVPTKRYDYHRLNAAGDQQWWIRRNCIEQLHRNYKSTNVEMPENESLLDIISKQNELKQALQVSVLERDHLNAMAKVNEQETEQILSVLSNTKLCCDEAELESKKISDKLANEKKHNESLLKEINTHQRVEKELALKNIELQKECEALRKEIQDINLEKTRIVCELDQLNQSMTKAPQQAPAVDPQPVPQLDKVLNAKEKRKEKRKADRRAKKTAKASAESSSESDDQKESKPPAVVVTPPPAPPLKAEPEQAAKGPMFADKSATKPFVLIRPDVHTKWNNDKACECHACHCKDDCYCDMMCIWCNTNSHWTKDCDLAKKGECGCGARTYKDKKHCCWKEGDKCIVCKGDHHPKKCHALNHRYWTATNREAPETFDKAFKRPDFQ